MESFTVIHKINIAVHVAAGSLALIVGLVALIVNKGKKLHRLTGRLFLMLMSVVILTGLIGVFVFGRNTFLLVITVLSGYLAFSGYRVIKAKSNVPKVIDIGICLLSLISVSYFLYYFKSIGMIWSPVIIYSTVGYLFLMIVYDCGRYFIPAKTYANLWIYEHILKMVSAFSGLLSAFSGTVFPQYQPYSQFIPSILGTLTAICFMIHVSNRKKYVDVKLKRIG
ncbi:hypothetical protein SNE25_16495 [Mucilaginibacter sabulilitoris]|uniref:DUF2306 domain-containing protein n=1 Tax=Mucilaginibacter sabulilitoris TaxID=1173583 RepID=A0ABZ0TH65_9SPHI|nr:hypothetical protein [Mucilaginibacter sabulilitoris]WPU90920.1 hypothetical protein SNE25_16495 [Mucilaginibacter sabulilitoris]